MTPSGHTPPTAAGTSNRKIVLIVVGVVAALTLIVALFVGSIIGFVFYTINHSEAAQTARTFLRQNERLRQDIGEIRDFGWLVSGQINTAAGEGQANLTLTVHGARKTVPATVALAYRGGAQWRVFSAYYRDDAGQIVRLLDRYEDESNTEPAAGQTRVQPTTPYASPPANDNK